VRVHQIVLSTLIGKRGIFAKFGATAPIAGVLRSLEAAIDVSSRKHTLSLSILLLLEQKFAFAMIDMIPTKSDDVTNDKNQLDQSVQNDIAAYQALCIPILGRCVTVSR
jgi:hypothetical protein